MYQLWYCYELIRYEHVHSPVYVHVCLMRDYGSTARLRCLGHRRTLSAQTFFKQGQEGPTPPALGIVSNTSQTAHGYLGRGLGPRDCRVSSGMGS